MSDSEKISITLKAGQGFDSPWIVVHADSAQEAATLLDAVALTGLGLKAATTAKGFQAEYAASELGVSHVATTVNNTAPAQPVAQPAAETAANTAPLRVETPQQDGTPTCHHGTKVWRVAKDTRFNSKTNQQEPKWQGWFCPSAKGTPDQCKPDFVNG